MVDALSRRAKAIQPSATLTLSTLAKQLKAEGRPVLDLSVGEPDLDTPAPVVAAAVRALDERHFRYTATPGVPALREAIARTYTERLRISIQPSNTMATNGAKQAIYNAMATVTDPGDRVLILAPYWVSYLEQGHALDCEMRAVPCPKEDRYRPDLDVLRRELADGAKVVVLNSPCNPTGAAYDRAEMSAIVDAIADSRAVLISDEIYEDIVYTEEGHVSPLHVQPDLFERCCVVTGLSKGFAMTGWRAGVAIAPTWWLNGMSRLQGHVTSNINAVTQQAAIEALAHRELIRPLVEVFRERRDLVLPWLGRIPEVTALPPEGTFYLYMDVSSYLGRTAETADTDSISKWLLEEHLIALVPGTAFGDPGRLRLSFAASENVLEEAFDRMASAFSSL